MSMDIMTLGAFFLIGFSGGFIGNISGGAALLEVPLLMLFGLPIPVLAGSLKLGNFCGAMIGAANYARRGCIALHPAVWAAAPAVMGGVAGAWLCNILPKEGFDEIIIAMLLTAMVLTFIPVGRAGEAHDSVSCLRLAAYAGGTFITGVYGGFLGPGVGTLCILLYLYTIGGDMVKACGTSRAVAICTDLGALPVFFLHGNIDLALTVPLALGCMAGGYAGSSLAMLKGSRIIRFFMLAVVAATLATLLWKKYM